MLTIRLKRRGWLKWTPTGIGSKGGIKPPFLPKRDSWGNINKGCEVWKADSQK